MCRICKEDDGTLVCKDCYNDPQIQAGFNWWKKKQDRKNKKSMKAITIDQEAMDCIMSKKEALLTCGEDFIVLKYDPSLSKDFYNPDDIEMVNIDAEFDSYGNLILSRETPAGTMLIVDRQDDQHALYLMLKKKFEK